MSAPIRIAINGFGRIGRALTRLILARPDAFTLVRINELEALDLCAYLFQYDSVYGPWTGKVFTKEGVLCADDAEIAFSHEVDIAKLDLSEIDLVFECTGAISSRAVTERGLAAGAKKVIVSGPSEFADKTIVIGANDESLDGLKIISNGSCTTNALAPLMRALNEAYGLISGHMTTVHCYTGSQPVVDKPHGDFARSRAAALSMVPTTTSAGRIIDEVLPELAGRVKTRAIRVPTASVSCIDLTVQLERPVSEDKARSDLQKLTENSRVFDWTDAPLVSTDLRMSSASLVISGPEISVSDGGLLRIFGWYDNEWGFSERMLDMARRIFA